MILYTVDRVNHTKDRKKRGRGIQRGRRRTSEVGKRRGYFEEILLIRPQSQGRFKGDITSYPNFAI